MTTVAWKRGKNPIEYAVEGSVFVAGAAIQWLRDQLGLLESASQSEALARSVPDTAGVYFVPAFVGLGAPHWDPLARGMMVGLTRGTKREHIVRAALEAVAFQTRDLLEEMAGASEIQKSNLSELRVDGGMAANDFFLELQADCLGLPVIRPRFIETTVLGAAYLAGLEAGMWKDLKELERFGRRIALSSLPGIQAGCGTLMKDGKRLSRSRGSGPATILRRIPSRRLSPTDAKGAPRFTVGWVDGGRIPTIDFTTFSLRKCRFHHDSSGQ